jgi:fructoselysine 6-kinase
MARLVGVGDNTVDRYISLKRMFPGGNAVNVAVLARRYGLETGYIGWLGNDPHGQLLYSSLKQEEVDLSHCRMVEGSNSYCEVNLVSGERVFGKSTAGVSSLIHLESEDFEYISRYDITHTSVYSFIEEQLAELSQASNLLSFDYSEKWSEEYLNKTLPHVDAAFLSGSELSREKAAELLKWISGRGASLVVLTQGIKGSLLFNGEEIYHQPIFETDVVDTLGAGDAFAARLLVEYFSGTPVEEALRQASYSASETCGYYGAWNHGSPLWDFN